MSDLLKLETFSAPVLTIEHSQNRCLSLQSTIDSAWAFIRFLNTLDAAMRLSFLNYLYVHHAGHVSSIITAKIDPLYEDSERSESKKYTPIHSLKKSLKQDDPENLHDLSLDLKNQRE